MVDKKELKKKFREEWKEHYDLPFFEEEGFERRACKICGQTFWSLEEREICGDPAHTGYQFIGRPAGKKADYPTAWEMMAEFYSKHGHTVVPRYPVVARWRDDMYFTIASIAVFQPYAVSGEVDPPANPLLIPQPCLRFNDVDNVGVSGRHMTNFVMVGQHAFNKERHVLWKNEAVELMFNYLVHIGIPKEEIVFHEDVWAGGGNFGPSIEYFVRGLELGNIVFMQFEEKGDSYKELDNKVIDHGIGLSRFAWITQGTTTAYDVVFPSVMEYLRGFYTPNIPSDVLKEFAALSGKLNFDESEDIEALMKEIEKVLDYPGFFEQYAPYTELYAIGDHTLTLLFSIHDGAFPSNVGGGYNLRVLARRIFSAMEKYGWDIDFYKVFELHAKDQERLFPELKEAVATAADVMDVEMKKYSESKKKGYSKVVTLYKKKGSLNVEDFVLLYQSYGIPPEEVEKITGVEAPKGIYSLLSKEEERVEEEEKIVDVSGYPKTELLYYADEKMYDFEAEVLGVIGNYVILDRTAFYPLGGGQDADLGELNGVPVTDVIKIDGVVLHEVKRPEAFSKGKKVVGKIDAQRRERLKRHHTAAHLLLAACREVLGRHVWQAGAKKTENGAHMDVTHYKRIGLDELRGIERKVNEYILRNIPVKKYFLPRTEAEKKFGVIIYQGGAVPGKELRIVEIVGLDVEACGGTHVDNTGEVGVFKVVKRESVADGVERIHYVVGDIALEHITEIEEILDKASSILRVPRQDLPKAAEKIFNMWKEAEKKLEKYAKDFARHFEKKKVYVFNELDPKTADALAESLGEAVFLARNSKPNVFIYGANASEELEKILEKYGGKGGGKGEKAVGTVEKIEELIRTLA